MASIIISPVGHGYILEFNMSGYSRTYEAPTLEAAQARGEKICMMLDIKPEVIKCWQPEKKKEDKKRARVSKRGSIPNGKK